MDKIAIYGAGGLGREMLLMLRQINLGGSNWQIAGFFDDGKSKGSVVDDCLVLGDLKHLNSVDEPLNLVIAIADPLVRKNIASQIKNSLIQFPVLVHPSVLTGSVTNVFGRGSILTAGTICTTGIVLGEFVIVNLATTLGHDITVESFTTIMPGCHISGNVRIGEESLIGSGAVILQNLKVGRRSRVGAGAVVVRNVPDETTVTGVPAKDTG